MPPQNPHELLRKLRLPLSELKTTVHQLMNTSSLSQAKLGEFLGRISRQVAIADSVVESLTDWMQRPGEHTETTRSENPQNIPERDEANS